MKTRCEYAKWKEYDMLAKWCAKHGVTGGNGTVLPDYIGMVTVAHDVNTRRKSGYSAYRVSGHESVVTATRLIGIGRGRRR